VGQADLVAGAQRCCYGTARNYCGQPATLHVLLNADGDPTMSCAEHASWWDTHEYHDTHPVGAVCGLPATTWLYAALSADGFTPSRCVVEGLDDLALAASAEAVRCS
jgi:hypothetical protein